MIPTPPPSSQANRKNNKLHEDTSNVEDEAFRRMLTRMEQSTNSNSQRNLSASGRSSGGFSNTGSSSVRAAGKKSAQSFSSSTSRRKSNTTTGQQRKSILRFPGGDNDDDEEESDAQKRAAVASSIQDLPDIISSLRGALHPRSHSITSNNSTAFGSTSIGDRESLEKEMLNSRYRSRSVVESSHQVTGQGKIFLQYEQEREQEKQMEAAKAARSTIAGGGGSGFGKDVTDPNGVLGGGLEPTATSTSTNRNNNAFSLGTSSQVTSGSLVGGGGAPNASTTNKSSNLDHLLTRANMSKAVTANIRNNMQQQNNNNNNDDGVNDDGQDGNNKPDATTVHEIENRVFGGGPVPKSLRVVVNEVKDQVNLKLKLSDIGTFRNCVQSLFECRSLIDQALKQMPSHWHFRDETFGMTSEDENIALINHQQQKQHRRQSKIIQQAAQQKLMSEMMEDCRRAAQQVHIPSAGYTLDEESGKINCGVTGSQSLYEINQAQHQKLMNTNTTMQQSRGTPTLGGNSESQLLITPSPSLTSGGGGGRNNRIYSTVSEILPAGASQYKQQQQQQFSPLPAFADFAGRSLKDSAAANSHSSTVDKGTLANALNLLDPESDNQRILRFLRKHTQQMSSSTQTDEKIKDELTKEDFVFQQQKVDELEVLVKEYEGTVNRLRNQLRIAQGALATRSGTVTYIRETLMKESSILKTQLQVLQQFQLHQQQLQQNNINNNNNNSSPAGSGSGGILSNQQQQSLPLLSPTLNNTTGSAFLGASSAAAATNRSQQQQAGLPSFARPMSSQSNYQQPGGLLNSTTTNFNNYSTTSYNNNFDDTNNQNMMNTTANQQQQQLNSGSASPNNQQHQLRPPPLSTLALQPLAPIYSLLDTIMCAVENEEVLEREHEHLMNNNNNNDLSNYFGGLHNQQQQQQQDGNETFLTGPSKESQLRDLRALFAQQQAHWKRQTADARSQFSLAMRRKNEQLKKVALKSNVNYLRETLLQMFSDFKDSFTDFKTSVKSAMKMHSNFMARTAKDLEFGIQKASSELENHQRLVKEREAIKGVIFALPDLIVPSLAPEFAMGYHSWSFADSNEPLKAFANSHFGSEITDHMHDELSCLHELFVEVQRFGVRVHQLPDVHRPKSGWLLSKVAQGLLRSPNCTNEVAMQIRTHLERDDALAKQQAKVNIAIHGVIIRRKVLADRIRQALREGNVEGCQNLSDEATLEDLTSTSPWDRSSKVSGTKRLAAINATFSDIPTCASRFNQFAEDIDTYHIKRMKLQQQRMENSRQLFHIWRNSGIDVTGGRYAIVARDPDAGWTSGLVKTRRLRGPGQNNNNNNNSVAVGGDNQIHRTASSSTMVGGERDSSSSSTIFSGGGTSGRRGSVPSSGGAMAISGRYGQSTGVAPPSLSMGRSSISPNRNNNSNNNNNQSPESPMSPRKRLVSVVGVDSERQ